MSTTTNRAGRAAMVGFGPVLLLASLSYHPYLPGRQPNFEALAAAVTTDPTRWGIAHLLIGSASGLLILAFIGVRDFLRELGEGRWSTLALPFVVIGSTLYAILTGMEFAPLAAVETGGSAQAAQTALLPWFLPVLVAGTVSFTIGVLGFALGIARSGVLSPELTCIVSAALVVMAAARFVPLSAVQFYVQGAAGFAAFLPLAYQIWKQPRVSPLPASHRL